MVIKVGMAAALAASLMACNPEEKSLKGGNSEKKPVSAANDLKVKDAADTDVVKKVATASYDIKVLTQSEGTLCLGKADLVIQSDFSMSFPKATLRCASLLIDLGKILAATGQKKSGDGKMTSDGKMLFVEKMGGATFSPARPFLVGPVIQNPEDYDGFTSSGKYDVTIGGKTQSGSINVKVLETKTTYDDPRFDKKLDDVLHWEMKATGYKNVAVAETFLFDKLEFWWNVRPIMVPKIVLQGELGDFMSKASGAGGGKADLDSLVGKLTLILTATKFQFEGS